MGIFILVLMFGDHKVPAGHIGAIHTNCKVTKVIRDAYDNAKFLCDQYYLCSPGAEFKIENSMLINCIEFLRI